MECPRCGGSLVRYRLEETESVTCRECAYVGVSVDHTAEDERPESWDDAIDRFQEQGQVVLDVTTRDDVPVSVPVVESDGEGVINGVEIDSFDGTDDLVLPVFDEAVAAESDEADLVRPIFDEASVSED